MISLVGKLDENLNMIQRQYSVSVLSRGHGIKISGPDGESVKKAKSAVNVLISMIENGENINEQVIRYVHSMVGAGEEHRIAALSGGAICMTAAGKPVKARTVGQKRYIDAIKDNTVIMGIGPAGTGKTYLAVAMAAKAFKSRETNKIILTRPAVEAGEKLGFLPGDMQNKVDPYLRPLYDALSEMFGAEAFAKHMERGNIEVAPLAYMRGRTLDESYIILDEAQNTTREQIKMFLTRLGSGSKMIITGDITQIDLPDARRSGLIDAARVLRNIEGITAVRLTEKDAVRHRLVQDIIKAYEKPRENKRKQSLWQD